MAEQFLQGPNAARRRRVVRALMAADALGLAAAFVIAELAFGVGSRHGDEVKLSTEFLLFFLTLPGWIAVAKFYELYDRDEERADHTTVDELMAVFHLITVGSWIFFIGTWATRFAEPKLSKIVAFWLLAIVFVTLARGAARMVVRRVTTPQNTVIVGAGSVGQLVARKLMQHPEYDVNLVGFIDADPMELRKGLEDVPLLGPPELLPKLIHELEVERVVVAFSREPYERTVELVRVLKRLNVQIDIVPRLFEVVGPNVSVHSIESLPLVGLPSTKPFPASRLIKRSLDVVGASIGLVLAAPLFAFAAWKVKRDSPGSIFFRQTRLGKEMREFTVIKFRTMRQDTDDAAHREFIKQTMSASAEVAGNGLYKLERSDAITPFGRWLRKTSIDELPQLLNVLRGEMSLVGPRPCLAYETENFAPHHFERFAVPAGITGLWQVTARAHATFGEALDMDVAYARNWSLGLDLLLLLKTPLHILRRKGTA